MAETPADKARRKLKEAKEQAEEEARRKAEATLTSRAEDVPAGASGLFSAYLLDEALRYFDALRAYLVKKGLWDELLECNETAERAVYQAALEIVGNEWKEMGLEPPSHAVLEAVIRLVGEEAARVAAEKTAAPVPAPIEAPRAESSVPAIAPPPESVGGDDHEGWFADDVNSEAGGDGGESNVPKVETPPATAVPLALPEPESLAVPVPTPVIAKPAEKPPAMTESQKSVRDVCLTNIRHGWTFAAKQGRANLAGDGIKISDDPDYVSAVQRGYREILSGKDKRSAEEFKKEFGEGADLAGIESEIAANAAKVLTPEVVEVHNSPSSWVPGSPLLTPAPVVPFALATDDDPSPDPTLKPKTDDGEEAADMKRRIVSMEKRMKRSRVISLLVFSFLLGASVVNMAYTVREYLLQKEDETEEDNCKLRFSDVAPSVPMMAEVISASGFATHLGIGANDLAVAVVSAEVLQRRPWDESKDPCYATEDWLLGKIKGTISWHRFTSESADFYPPLYMKAGRDLKDAMMRLVVANPELYKEDVRGAFLNSFAKPAVAALEEMERGKAESAWANAFEDIEAHCMSKKAEERYRVSRCVRKILVYDDTDPNATEEEKQGVLLRGLGLVKFYEAARLRNEPKNKRAEAMVEAADALRERLKKLK